MMRSRVAGVLAVALCMAGAVAEAAPVRVFQGTLGGAPVVLELGDTGGRYFYMKNGVDIPLHGEPGALAEALPLTEQKPQDVPDDGKPLFDDPSTGKPRVVWQGQLAGPRYEGTWRDARTGKNLPFSLRQVASYAPDASQADGGPPDVATLSMRTAPYDFLRMQAPLKSGPEVVQGPVAYRMVQDPRTRLRYPRLTRLPDAQVMARINGLLERRHWALSMNALYCASTAYTSQGPEAGTLGDFDQEQVKVDYLSPTLMSVVESGSVGCGGAYPDNHFEPYTLDLLRGGYLDFSRILQGYRRGPSAPAYSAAFMVFVKQAVRRTVRSSDDPNSCTEVWPQYLSLHFQQPGRLAFDVSGVPHVAGACLGTWMSLPFGQIKPLLKPEAARYLSIGATAVTHGLPLAARDTRHFEDTGPRLVNPWAPAPAA
jgi:hypothetical protein